MTPGERYGRLVSISFEGKRGSFNGWRFRCDCGHEHVTTVLNVRSGDTQSCGCLKREMTINRNSTHGHCGKDGFDIWRAMLARCYNPSNRRFASYGGRGITVCDRWRFGNGTRDGFECFTADMGRKPSKRHSLDRIDNDGNYEAANCRWTLPKEQMSNRRRTVVVSTPWGEMPLTKLAERLGVQPAALVSRLKRGWSHERLLEPIRRPSE